MLMHACGLFGNAWIVWSPRVPSAFTDGVGWWAVFGGDLHALKNIRFATVCGSGVATSDARSQYLARLSSW